jgi:BirA family biotin operon repressor/biotin-[acetyl-CoA-carboxylase] ligase
MSALILNLEAIEAALCSKTLGRCASQANELWEEIDSTNSRALALARESPAVDGNSIENEHEQDKKNHGFFILARKQNLGRGRLGRQWQSPKDAGIAFSLLLRPRLPAEHLGLVTIAAGAAAACAIEKELGLKIGLKWVNDLVYEGRKLGGILAEMSGGALVIGIGLNLRFKEEEIPEELKGKIEWLERLNLAPVNPNSLVATLLGELERVWLLLQDGQTESILRLWRHYAVTLGEEIIASSGTVSYKGKALDIDNDGALIIETAEGKCHRLHAGEISIRKADGSYG